MSASGGGSWFRRPVTWVAVSVVVVLALVAGVFFVLVGDDEASAGEVILEPADEDGEDPFFDSVATASVDVAGGGVEDVTGDQGGVESLSGATPGLYGGTGDDEVCDPEALVGFLEGDADKAGAFAEVLGIAPDEIAEYIGGLTPLVLREDTRVTNHGFADGRATPRQAVFQAGTAVLVDDFGVPRVRCACGNPLSEPEATSGTPTFSGDTWSSFDDTRLVAVAPASEPQTDFEVVDVDTGDTYTVPVTSGNGMTVEALLNVALPGWGCDGEDAQLVDGTYECAYGDVASASPGWEPILQLSVAGVGGNVEAAAYVGDLTGDGRDEGVIVVDTSDSGVASGFLNSLVFVFAADGEPLPLPGTSTAGEGSDSLTLGWVEGLETEFKQTVSHVAITDGVLEIVGTGPRDCRACEGPERTLRFRWDGSAFVGAP